MVWKPETFWTPKTKTVTQSFSNLYRHPRQEKYHSSVSKARWLPSLGTDLRLPFYHLRLPQPGWRLNVFNSQWGPRLSLKYKSAEIHHGKDLKSGLEYKKHFPPKAFKNSQVRNRANRITWCLALGAADREKVNILKVHARVWLIYVAIVQGRQLFWNYTLIISHLRRIPKP